MRSRNPIRLNSTRALVSILTGGDPVWEETDGNSFDMSDLNPGKVVHLDPENIDNTKGGVIIFIGSDDVKSFRARHAPRPTLDSICLTKPE